MLNIFRLQEAFHAGLQDVLGSMAAQALVQIAEDDDTLTCRFFVRLGGLACSVQVTQEEMLQDRPGRRIRSVGCEAGKQIAKDLARKRAAENVETVFLKEVANKMAQEVIKEFMAAPAKAFVKSLLLAEDTPRHVRFLEEEVA